MTATAAPTPLSRRYRFARRLYFFAYINGIGLLSNLLAAQLPGGVPFLLGNMAYAVIVLRLGVWWGLASGLLITTVIEQPALRLLALSELLLIALFVRHWRWRIGKALLSIWSLLLPLVLWLIHPSDGDPQRWLLSALVVIVTGMVTLIGARMIASITLPGHATANDRFARQIGNRLTVAAATPLTILAVITLNLSMRGDQKALASALEKQSQELARLATDQLELHQRALELLAREPSHGNDQDQQGLARLQTIYPGFLHLLRTDANGRVLVQQDERLTAAENRTQITERAYFLQPKATAQPYLSPVLLDPDGSRQTVIALSAPIPDPSGQFAGVVVGLLAITPLSQLLTQEATPLALDFVLVDHHGQVVASSVSELPALARIDISPLLAMPAPLSYAPQVGYNSSQSHWLTVASLPGKNWRLFLLKPMAAHQLWLLQWSALTATACLALMLFLRWQTYRFAGDFTRPLEQLVERIRTLDLNDPRTLRPLAVQGNALETQELISDFELMVQRLRELHQDIIRAYQEQRQLTNVLDARVQERTKELLQAVQRAEKLSTVKSTFLANMSHELRTPLTAIIGYTEQALRHGMPPSRWHESLRVIERNSRFLLDVVNDILDASKIEFGSLQLESAPLSPLTLVRDVVSQLQPRADEKRLLLQLELQWPLPATLHGDAFRLKQILFNLLGNSIKFTSAGQVTVRLRASAVEQRWQLQVQDTGIGMTLEQQQKLFVPFEQADVSTTRKFGGTGLGLYISHQLVQRMGGQVLLDSEPGVGSCFTVDLPLQQACDWQHNPPELPMPAPTPATALPVPRLQGKVLLAEDMADIRQLVSQLIAETGASVVAVENGELAVSRALAEPFDLILLDMHMPVLDGREAIKLLRAAGYDGTIVALTADVLAEDVANLLAAGANQVLAKPINQALLLNTLADYLPAGTAAQSEAADPALLQLLTELRQKFCNRLPEQLSQLQQAVEQENHAALQALLHNLKGSAGTFGYAELSKLAAAAEPLCKQALPPAELAAALSPLLLGMAAVTAATNRPETTR